MQQSQGTHLEAVLICRMNFKKRRTDKQGWLTKPTTLKQLNNSFSLYSLRKQSYHFAMPALVSVRNDVSEEQTRQKFHTGVSCVTAQIRVVLLIG